MQFGQWKKGPTPLPNVVTSVPVYGVTGHPHMQRTPPQDGKLFTKRGGNKSETESMKQPVGILDKGKPLWLRIVWAVLVGISFCACIYQIADRFIFYLSDPITTDVAIIRNASVKYPSITMCLMPDANTKLINLKKKYVEEHNRGGDFCGMNHYELVDRKVVKSYSALWDNMSARQLNIARFAVLVSPAGPELINVTITEKMVRTSYGECITYTIPEMQIFAGYRLLVAFSIPLVQDFCRHMISLVGFYAHDDSINPKHSMNFYFAGIEKGTTYIAKMRAKHFKNLNLPRDPCTSSSVYEACYDKCLDRIFISKLVCKSPVLENLNLPFCWNSTVLTESLKKMVSITTETDPRTDCGCKRKCSDTIYEFDLQFLRKYNGGNGEVSPTFASNIFEVISEKRVYTLISFICDAGGNCGLFLGLSLLSLLDTIEVMCGYCRLKSKQRRI